MSKSADVDNDRTAMCMNAKGNLSKLTLEVDPMAYNTPGGNSSADISSAPRARE